MGEFLLTNIHSKNLILAKRYTSVAKRNDVKNTLRVSTSLRDLSAFRRIGVSSFAETIGYFNKVEQAQPFLRDCY